MRTALSFLLIALLTGCNVLGLSDSSDAETSFPPPETNVTYTTEASTYDAESDVELVLQNDSDRSVQYNLCSSTLERRRGGEWGDADVTGIVCTAVLKEIPGGKTARFDYPLSDLESTLPAGTYRFRTDVSFADDEDDNIVLRTPAFDVEAP